MMCGCSTRRGFLMGSAALGATGLSACDEVSLVSDEELARMGEETWRQILADVPESRNANLRGATSEVSAQLLAASGQSVQDWDIRVFASPQINAFALPGRKIGVYEGMFQAARTADQLAAIIGHEIGHLQAEHARKRVTAQIAKDSGLQLLNWALEAGDVQFAREIAGALGVGIELGLVLPYSRNQETEADRIGVHIMHDAGFAAEEAITLWQRMASLSDNRGPEFLATHPQPTSRITEIRALIPTLDT